ncbi:MAG: hypothetical protein OEY59_05135 [Deltaproteobacteria bacterium]|nr:hypothetical protein [Deltaproteobacteria bacterium]
MGQRLKKISIIIVIGLFGFLFFACDEDKGNPSVTTSDDGSKIISDGTLSSNLIMNLGTDLQSAGFSKTQVSVVQAGSEQVIINESLANSTEIHKVAPYVLKGAELAVSNRYSYLATTENKIKAVKVIASSVTRSLNGNISSQNSALKFSGYNFGGKRLLNTAGDATTGSGTLLGPTATDATIDTTGVDIGTITTGDGAPIDLADIGEKYVMVLQSIANFAVQYIDETGIVSEDINQGLESSVNGIVGKLVEAGVPEESVADVAGAVAKGAVSGLTDAGITPDQISGSLESVLNGIFNGLVDNGYSNTVISSSASKVTQGAILGLEGPGLSVDKLNEIIGEITQHVNKDLGIAGLSPSEIADLQEEILIAAENGKSGLMGVEVISHSNQTSEEGTEAIVTIKLTIQPQANVVVNINSSNPNEGSIYPTSLTFTPDNWNAEQVVTVTGVDDELADGTQAYSIAFDLSASVDSGFQSVVLDQLLFNNIDNDSAGISVTSVFGNTNEAGGNSYFGIRLNSQPFDSVQVSFQSDDLTEGIAYPSSLTFTADNWNADQTVTVTGVDDDLTDGDVVFDISFNAIVSADSDYSSLLIPKVSVTNTDNDTAGFTISSISGNTSESGASATFDIRLNSQPTSGVVIPVSSSRPGEATVYPASLTFTVDNWNANQTVTVTGVDDFYADGNQSFTVILGQVATLDLDYSNLNPADVSGLNIDNDSAGFIIGSISNDTIEPDGTASFNLRLTSKPTADVNISVMSNDLTEGTVYPENITFTSTNWNADQIVTVTGADDFVQDGNQSYLISFTLATSSDLNYNGLKPLSISTINIDNDSAGFIVSQISGPVLENGQSASFTVQLTSQPTADVVIQLSSSDLTEGKINPTSLIFTPANWKTAQSVNVMGIDDMIADGNQSFSILLSEATSADLGYMGLKPNDVAVENLDDESAGFIVSKTLGNTSEAGGSTSFTVKLTSQPFADVMISVTSGDLSEGTVNPDKLTFTADNWNAGQIVNVTGVDDAIMDGNQSFKVLLGAANSVDVAYKGIRPGDVTVINIDDDSAGFITGAFEGIVTESGDTGSFTVRLTSQPLGDVQVQVSSSDLTEAIVSPGSLVFTANNWNANQVVSVTGVDDAVADGNQTVAINLSMAASSDPDYDNLKPPSVLTVNIDNDSAGYIVSGVRGSTTESGGQASFSIELTSQPTGNVEVSVASSNTGEATVYPASLVFTPNNWNAKQTVTATGVDDMVADGNQGYIINLGYGVSSDNGYNGLKPLDVALINIDNDSAGILVGSLSGIITENGDSASFTIRLTSQPFSDVTIQLNSSDPSEGTISSAKVVFTSSNWNAAQSVRITGVDDAVADGNQNFFVNFSAAQSTDSGYSGIKPADLTLQNIDNDSAGVMVGTVSGNTTETGGQATLTVSLASQPLGEVKLGVSSSDPTEGLVSPSNLNFTPTNWNAPQTLIVSGVDDDLADGNQSYSIVFDNSVSTDMSYQGIKPQAAVLQNIDNDSAGINVSEISGNTTEAGGSASFAVSLASQPFGDVAISLTSSDLTEGRVVGGSLIFTASNWNAAQTVSVVGVDDSQVDGNQGYSVVLSPASSSDGMYDGLKGNDVSVVNIDNDSSGIIVSVPLGTTTEMGGTTSFSISLTSQPISDVDIAVTSTNLAEGSVFPNNVTFNSTNWDVAQTVTVTGADDTLADGNQTYIISLASAISGDGNYNGMKPNDVSVTNIDNDSAGVIVSSISGHTTESGETASFTVELTSSPYAEVKFSLSSSDLTEGTLSQAYVAFNAGNWNVPQKVTVTGADDAIQDGDQSYLIHIAAAVSQDSGYHDLKTSDVTVVNRDNDSAGINSSSVSGNTTENGGKANIKVRLLSEPISPVSVTVQSSNTNEGVINPTFLEFNAANWNSEQVIEITGVADGVVDGDQTYQITFQPSQSLDANYDGITLQPQTLKNIDVDVAQGPSEEQEIKEISLFAINKIKLDKDVIVESGSLVVNSLGGSIEIERESSTAGGFNVKADTITLKDNAVIGGDAFYNLSSGSGTISGSSSSINQFPIISKLPAFSKSEHGDRKIKVKDNKVVMLEPGAYDEIEVMKNSTLVFKGGLYSIKSIEGSEGARIEFNASSEVTISKEIKLKERVYLGPSSNASIDSSGIILYVADSRHGDGDDDDHDNSSSVIIGKGNNVKANIYAPNGRVMVKKGCVVEGSIWAKEIDVDKDSKVLLNSSF